MDEYLKFLVQHMATKGLGPQMISGLIRDVANILLDCRYITRTLVNEKLAYLGWDQSILDETSLQLIIFILEHHGVLKRTETLHKKIVGSQHLKVHLISILSP